MKHLGDNISTIRVGDNVSHSAEITIHVAEWRCTWSPAHFAFGPYATLYVNTLVVIFELGLGAENHQQEFLVWTIGECLRVGADMEELLLIH